jgi:hypothetical protein
MEIPLTLPSPRAYRQAGAGERDGVRGEWEKDEMPQYPKETFSLSG